MAGRWMSFANTVKSLERACNDRAKSRRFLERRRYPRFPARGISCNLGLVKNISRGGVRIESTRRCRAQEHVVLGTSAGRLDLPARTVWMRRLGFRRYDVGLEFTGLDEPAARLLARISTDAR